MTTAFRLKEVMLPEIWADTFDVSGFKALWKVSTKTSGRPGRLPSSLRLPGRVAKEGFEKKKKMPYAYLDEGRAFPKGHLDDSLVQLVEHMTITDATQAQIWSATPRATIFLRRGVGTSNQAACPTNEGHRLCGIRFGVAHFVTGKTTRKTACTSALEKGGLSNPLKFLLVWHLLC